MYVHLASPNLVPYVQICVTICVTAFTNKPLLCRFSFYDLLRCPGLIIGLPGVENVVFCHPDEGDDISEHTRTIVYVWKSTNIRQLVCLCQQVDPTTFTGISMRSPGVVLGPWNRSCFSNKYYMHCLSTLDTYDHRSVKTGHPVRSAIHKH
jgi:hypothetical protein